MKFLDNLFMRREYNHRGRERERERVGIKEGSREWVCCDNL